CAMVSLLFFFVRSRPPRSPLFPYTTLFRSIMGNDPAARPNATLGLSLFHTAFNVLNVVILFAFVPYIVRLIERLLPDNGPQDDQYQLKYISLGVMTSPGLSVEQAQKEIQNFAEIIEKMHGLVDELLFDPQAPREKLLERIHAYEETTDQLEMEISDYLVNITENTNLEHELTERMRFMQTMINDMERIADIYFQVSKLSDRMLEAKTNWPEE